MDDDWNTVANTVSRQPFSVTATDDSKVYYIGVDSKIHEFVYDLGDWRHTWIPYTYGNPSLRYPNGDYPKAGIAWDTYNQQVVYPGGDGRLQYFHKNSDNTWSHWWLDDYWSTDEFSTFVNEFPNVDKYASVAVNGSGMSFYCGRGGELRYFRYEPCEKVIPCNNTPTINLMRGIKVVAADKGSEAKKLRIYPNPVKNILTVELPLTARLSEGGYFKLYSSTGQVLRIGVISNSDFKVDLTNLTQGIYMLKVNVGTLITSQKIVKE